MTYNIHPIFVHFPIALLLFYSLVKILPLKKWVPSVSWKHIERALLFGGVLGSFIASSTGEIAEHLVHPNRALVEMHSTFAAASTWIYALLLLGEVLSMLNISIIPKLNIFFVTRLSMLLQKILTNNILSKALALAGLVTISVTGLLGGVMVYGVSADPVAPMILKILGITLN